MFSYLLSAKGVDHPMIDAEVDLVCADLVRLAYRRVAFKSDNEPALLALFKVVTDNLPGVEAVPRNSSEGDHAAN